MSAVRAAAYLLDEGPHRRAQAVALIRGVVADEGSSPDEVAGASILLRRLGLIDEATDAACIATARGAVLPSEVVVEKQRWCRRHISRFSRAA